VSRAPEDTALTDAYCTPLWLARRVGRRDVDPCSNPRSWIDAAWSFSLEKGLDGLRLPWWGSAFVNWPYSTPLAWAEKCRAELAAGRCTDLIILCKLDPSPRWWNIIIEPALAVLDRWDLDMRLDFEPHPELIERKRQERLDAIARGDEKVPPAKTSSNFASVVLHHRAAAAPALQLHDVATLWRRVTA
jgi:hypothetical protein